MKVDVEENECLRDKFFKVLQCTQAQISRRTDMGRNADSQHFPSNCFMAGRTIGCIIRDYTTLIIEDYTKRHNNTAIIIYQQLGLKFFF